MMDEPTRKLGKYVRETGISVVKISEQTGISYTALYDSLLHKGRDRDLRIGEFFSICKFLERDPMDFIDEENARGGF